MSGPRAVAVLAAAAILAAACNGAGGGEADDAAGGEGGEGGGGPITVWSTENQPDRLAATEEMVAAFTEASGIEVELTGIAEDELPNLMIANAASGDLPDVVYHPLDFAAGWAQEGLLDPEAAQQVIDELGADTFSQASLDLVAVDGAPVTIPSDAWGQLLVYRQDLFDEAGLDVPDTYDAIRAAAEALHDPGSNTNGITASTDPADVFTQQTFEHFALANGCRMVEGEQVALNSQACTDAIAFYSDLIENYSPGGNQNVDSTRATYFAGQAAMIVWSPFILDEMAGLRQDALPNCPECEDNPAYLAENSGFVTAFSGGDAEPAQYGQVSYLGITGDADVESAVEFAKYWFSDGYLDWLAVAPEGKIPMRQGTAENPEEFVEGWRDLDVGVDEKAPLSDFYGDEVIDSLLAGTEEFDRWGFAEGFAPLVSSVYQSLVVPQTINDVVTGGLTPEQAAEELQTEVDAQLQQVGGGG